MFRNHYNRNDDKLELLLNVLKWLIIGAGICIVIFLLICYYSEKNYTATVTDKDIMHYNSGSKFLVFTKTEDGETRVFSMEDTLIKGRLDTADDYAEIEIGETYSFTVIGYRIPLLSEYENIIEFQVIA